MPSGKHITQSTGFLGPSAIHIIPAGKQRPRAKVLRPENQPLKDVDCFLLLKWRRMNMPESGMPEIE